MTQYYQSDRSFTGRRTGVTNHLRNGAFMVYRSFTARNFADPAAPGVSKVSRTQYVHRVTDNGTSPSVVVPTTVPGFFVEATPPKEQMLGSWDVWGTNARLYFNRECKSLDGGNLMTVAFFGKGEVTLRQGVESFHKFLGKTVTVAVTGRKVTDFVKVSFAIDAGVSVLESRPFFSDYFGSYYRMLATFDIPLGATKFDVSIKVSGDKDGAAGLSGAVLAIGAYAGDMPYSDSLPDVAVPAGTVIAWVGDSCPSGYRSLGEDIYMMQVLGDPNAVRGNLYTGATVAPGSEDSMGPRGSLDLGSSAHTHAGAPGFHRQTHEIEGLAFEPSGEHAVLSEIDYSGKQPTYMRRSDRGYYSHRVLPDRDNVDFAPPRGSSVRPYDAPPAHKHEVRFPGEDVEPPRVKVKLCEKI